MSTAKTVPQLELELKDCWQLVAARNGDVSDLKSKLSDMTNKLARLLNIVPLLIQHHKCSYPSPDSSYSNKCCELMRMANLVLKDCQS